MGAGVSVGTRTGTSCFGRVPCAHSTGRPQPCQAACPALHAAAAAPHHFLMSGQRGSKICDREQLRNISHFNWGALMRTISIGEGRVGGRGAGFGAGERYFVLEIFVVRGSRTEHLARESECTSRGTNLLLPIRVRFPQCSLEWGPLSPCSSPSLSRVEMKPPTPTSPLRCLIELRAGSVHDSDLGFSHRMARAFGALRAAPLPREHGERVTK